MIRPPADESTRARVEALRTQLAHLKAVWRAGRCTDAQPLAKDLLSQVRALRYEPLLAESLLAIGSDGEDCTPVAERISMLEESFSTAFACHHDEVAAQSASVLPGLFSDRLRQPPLARQWITVARAAIARIGGHAILSATVDFGESVTFQYEGRAAEALAAAHRAREAQEKLLGKDHPYTLSCLNGEGETLIEVGRYPEALATLTAARDGTARTLGAAHPDVAMIESNLGELLNEMHRYAEARAAFGRALNIWSQAQVDPMIVTYGRTGLGLALLGDGRPAEAVPPLRQALEARLAAKAAPALIGETRFALARALWAMPGQRLRAEELARQARADYGRIEKRGDAPPPEIARIDAWLATPVASL